MSFARMASLFGGAALLAMLLHCGGSEEEDANPNPLTPTSGQGTTGSSGASSSSGGASSSSGASGTSGSSGASSGSSGTSGSSGMPPAGCGGAAADPAAAQIVQGFVDKVPAANRPSGALRTSVVDIVLKACQAFGPPPGTAGWDKKYCWAQLVASINKESAYNPASVILDAYGTRNVPGGKANDPTIGLLQMRFSSTVRDYTQNGNLAALACTGCNLPADFASHKNEADTSAFWAQTGATANMKMMQSVECNIGFGAWYYYMNATGNGSAAKTTYLHNYCANTGTAGNVVTGLLSHLKGPDVGRGKLDQAGVNALQTKDSGAYQYVTQIKSLFDTMVPPPAGTHPFFLTLAPNVPQYCKPK